MINWIKIDGVEYHFDGQNIKCVTDVGYNLSISGSLLENVEINDSEENIISSVTIDFLNDSIYSRHMTDGVDDVKIVYSLDGIEKETYVSEREQVCVLSCQDILGSEDESLMIWSDIVHGSSVEYLSISEYISFDQVLSGDDNLSQAFSIESHSFANELDYNLFFESSIDLPLIVNSVE